MIRRRNKTMVPALVVLMPILLCACVGASKVSYQYEAPYYYIPTHVHETKMIAMHRGASSWRSPGQKAATVRQRYHQVTPIAGQQPFHVVRVGHSRLLSLSSDRLFIGRSANFNVGARMYLDAVVDYLRDDDMLAVEVSAYTDNAGYPLRDRIVSNQRAAKIVHYLAKRRIPANIIYAVGCGQCPIIARNHTHLGRYHNRRVEIRYQILGE